MKKYAFFAFKGEAMCFTHVLLNAIDMHNKGLDVKIIIEGEAVKLIKEMSESNNPVFNEARELNLIDCVCKACSAKMKVLQYNEFSSIRVSGDMSGHPSMLEYIYEGYEIITL